MKKRIISLLLSLVIMAAFVIPINVFAEEETTRTYTGNSYEITYDIKGSWVGNQNVEVTIRNTGTESLLNWALKYDAHGEINGLWNGTVFSSDSTKYIVKNAGYNYEIQPEQSVTFGYTLSGEYMEFPEAIELCSQRTERSAEGYSVTIDVTDDWDTGFTGTVTIKNLGESSLEAWRLSFDTNFVIDDIWNAQILSSFENSYTVANDITTTPIGAGESKIFGFKATKEPGVTPEMTDFVMSEITVNEDFTTIDIPEITLAVSCFANYLEEENALNIFWYTNVENGRFELLESYNNEDFITTVILNNEYSYTYPITMDFDMRYFKVIQTTDDGQTAESPVFCVEKTEDGYSAKFIDSDGDGLPDFVEEQIGTDVNNEDTDGDGLTDYQEYYILGTDPSVYDSVTKGVSDADADCDGDGLSNIREFELGTKPFNPDTDNDGLTDGDEVNIYGTDPLKYDTDDDGISDGDEIALGTDPLSPTTDGIADTERTFVQTIEADDDILEDINTEYNPYDLSLEITAAGNAHTSLTVQESGYSDSMFNWSILGICPELIYDNSCKVDEVVLKFKVDEEYIDNPNSEYAKENSEFEGIKRYNVFRFFEEDNILLPVKTDVDAENNTVSATVSDLGTYCLIDMEMFLKDIVAGADNSDIEIASGGQTTEMLGAGIFGMLNLTASSSAAKVKPAIDYGDEFNVVFMYDIDAEGYSDFYNSVCDTTDFIFNKSVNANVYFVELDKPSVNLAYSAQYECSAGGYVDENKYDFHDSFLRDRNFLNNKDADSSRSAVVSDAFDFVVNGIKCRDGSYTEIVNTDLPTLCFSFFSDESAVYRESTGYSLLDNLVSENVFVNLIGNYDFSTYIGGYAKDLYQQTGGKYFKLSNNNISDALIKYIYNVGDVPQIEYQYNLILSCGLRNFNLDGPINIGAYYASTSITKNNHNSDEFSKFADTDKDG
ncbi:MAG: cellulose binding domain-containing protein, partial [Ruminococcus sp.]|nr:cellulose binding domain-containing protein [Ruminococcus sp.]